MPDSGGWNRWERFVVSKLEESTVGMRDLLSQQNKLRDEVAELKEKIGEDITETKVEIAKLKTHASLLGFLAGSIPIIAGLIYQLVQLYLKQ